MSGRRSRISARPNVSTRPSRSSTNNTAGTSATEEATAEWTGDPSPTPFVNDTEQTPSIPNDAVEDKSGTTDKISAAPARQRRPRIQVTPSIRRKPKAADKDQPKVTPETPVSTESPPGPSSENLITQPQSNINIILEKDDQTSQLKDKIPLLESETIPTEVTSPIRGKHHRPKAQPNVVGAGKARLRRLSGNFDNASPLQRVRHPSTDKPSQQINDEELMPPPSTTSANSTSQSVSSETQDNTELNVMQDEVDADAMREAEMVEEYTRRRQLKKRRKVIISDDAPDTTKMTIKDLMYFQPTSNPMANPAVKPRAKKKRRGQNIAESVTEANDDDNESIRTESTLPTPSPSPPSSPSPPPPSLPQTAPQIMIGDDGEILVNENSLVVNHPIQEMPVYKGDTIQGDSELVNYSSFRENRNTKFWTTEDTRNFYKALNFLGTDFTLMSELFPKRNRTELKNKFKREEKCNLEKIECALKGRLNFDAQPFPEPKPPESKKVRRRNNAKALGMEGKGGGLKRARAFCGETQEEEKERRSDLGQRKRARYRSASTKRMPTKETRDNEGDDSSDDSENESSSTVTMTHIPTRSGRMPKRQVIESTDTSSPDEPSTSTSYSGDATSQEKSTSQHQDVVSPVRQILQLPPFATLAASTSIGASLLVQATPSTQTPPTNSTAGLSQPQMLMERHITSIENM